MKIIVGVGAPCVAGSLPGPDVGIGVCADVSPHAGSETGPSVAGGVLVSFSPAAGPAAGRDVTVGARVGVEATSQGVGEQLGVGEQGAGEGNEGKEGSLEELGAGGVGVGGISEDIGVGGGGGGVGGIPEDRGVGSGESGVGVWGGDCANSSERRPAGRSTANTRHTATTVTSSINMGMPEIAFFIRLPPIRRRSFPGFSIAQPGAEVKKAIHPSQIPTLCNLTQR